MTVLGTDTGDTNAFGHPILALSATLADVALTGGMTYRLSILENDLDTDTEMFIWSLQSVAVGDPARRLA